MKCKLSKTVYACSKFFSGFVIVAGDAYDSPPLLIAMQSVKKYQSFLHNFLDNFTNRLFTGCPVQIPYGRLLTCLFYFQLIMIQSPTAILNFTLKSLVAIFMMEKKY